MNCYRTFIFVFFLATLACTHHQSGRVAAKDHGKCDPFPADKPEIKDYKTALKVWLDTLPLDSFLKNRQSVWREAKAWYIKTYPVDSHSIVKCLSGHSKNISLYIPNQYYVRESDGSEYFKFFIVNQTADTIQIPRIDFLINNISSVISPGDKSKWLPFQHTANNAWCGNSYWSMKLSPKAMIESRIECKFINLGNTSVDYRLQLTLDGRKILSNGIMINLIKDQLLYIGTDERHR